MKETIAYKRPTTPVRIRPYIFYRSIQNYTLQNTIPGAQIANVITLQPQGNIADGNRVTHGWKIYANGKWNSPIGGVLILNINGNIVDFGNATNPVCIIDTTLDPLGIDSTVYKIFNAWDDGISISNVNLFVVEQILQISPM